MSKIIIASLPDTYTRSIIKLIDNLDVETEVKLVFTAHSLLGEYKEGDADIIFLDTTLADASIEYVAERIREIDKNVMIVGMHLTKDNELIEKFKKIPKTDFILKLDDNELIIEKLIKESENKTYETIFDTSAQTSGNSSKKILVVDDFENTRFVIQFTLEKEGYQTVTATDGIDALQKLKQNPDLDLIITDLNMPRMDGFQFIEEIRNQGLFEKKPILILTTEIDPAKKEKAKELKITGWIKKPYQLNEFLDIIKKAMN